MIRQNLTRQGDKNMRSTFECLSDRNWNPPGIKPSLNLHKMNMKEDRKLGLDLDGAHRLHGRLDVGTKQKDRRR